MRLRLRIMSLAKEMCVCPVLKMMPPTDDLVNPHGGSGRGGLDLLGEKRFEILLSALVLHLFQHETCRTNSSAQHIGHLQDYQIADANVRCAQQISSAQLECPYFLTCHHIRVLPLASLACLHEDVYAIACVCNISLNWFRHLLTCSWTKSTDKSLPVPVFLNGSGMRAPMKSTALPSSFILRALDRSAWALSVIFCCVTQKICWMKNGTPLSQTVKETSRNFMRRAFLHVREKNRRHSNRRRGRRACANAAGLAVDHCRAFSNLPCEQFLMKELTLRLRMKFFWSLISCFERWSAVNCVENGKHKLNNTFKAATHTKNRKHDLALGFRPANHQHFGANIFLPCVAHAVCNDLVCASLWQ